MTTQAMQAQDLLGTARVVEPQPVFPSRPKAVSTQMDPGPAAPRTQSTHIPGADWVLEESFEGTIEEIGADAVRLHTTSLDGEEGEPWLPLARIPESERKWIALGVPVRVAVLYDCNAKPRRRENHIRLLRPTQWRAPVTPAMEASQ